MTCRVSGGGGGTCSSLPAAGSFVVGVPVLLLTLDGAVRGVPAAVVHGLLLTVITLETRRTRPAYSFALKHKRFISFHGHLEMRTLRLRHEKQSALKTRSYKEINSP